MTGNKTEIALRIELVCLDCDSYGRDIKMEMDGDMEGQHQAEYKCPKCGNKVRVEFMLGN